MKEILNDREYEQIVLVIAKDKGFDVFTDIINEVERLSDTDGYFKLVDNIRKLGGDDISFERNNKGDTLLHSAVRSGDILMVAYIVDKSPSAVNLINEKNNYLEIPLEVSILTPKKNMNIIRYLLEKMVYPT